MCGILGIVNHTKHGYKENISDFQKSLHLMDHRGPDASDVKYNKKFIHRQILIKAIKK